MKITTKRGEYLRTPGTYWSVCDGGETLITGWVNGRKDQAVRAAKFAAGKIAASRVGDTGYGQITLPGSAQHRRKVEA